MSTFKPVILKGKNDVKKDGTTNVKIRITQKGQHAYIPTNIFIIPDDLDDKTGMCKSGPNKASINLKITSLLLEYRRAEMEIENSIEYMSASTIKDFLLKDKKKIHEIDFLEFIDIFSQTTSVPGTKEQYLSLKGSLISFTGKKLPVSIINLDYLLKYESFLRSRGVQNGVINYMRNFRSLFNKCRDYYNDDDSQNFLIPHYPFKKYVFPKRKPNSKKHYLDPQEFKLLLKYSPKNAGEEFARDMFLLMFYLIGIEAKDLFHLPKPTKGRILYDRFKTGKEFSIKLEPEALEIINKYKHPKFLLNVSDRFQLHKSFYRYINNYLSGEKPHNIVGIFQNLKISKHVTTKWARHTWATIARNQCHISKDDIALCLGHEDAENKVTDTYIDYDYSIIDKNNRKVIDFIKS